MSGQTGKVDVLNMLRKFQRTYMTAGLEEEAADIGLIFDAVAELFKAATEAFGAPDVMWTIASESDALAQRLEDALARIGSES